MSSPVGVGMVLRAKHDGALEVTEIVEGGPVDQSGVVALGDILKKVDGAEVGRTVDSARKLLLGTKGTKVTLTLTRHEPFFGFDAVRMEHSFNVSVTRNSVELRANRSSSGRSSTDKKSEIEGENLSEVLKGHNWLDISALKDENLKLLMERDDLKSQISERKKETEDGKAEVADLQDKIYVLNSEVAVLADRNQGLMSQIDGLQKRAMEADRFAEQTEASMITSKEVKELQEELSSMKFRNSRLAGEFDVFQATKAEEITTFSSENRILKRQVQELESAISSLSQEQARSQGVMQQVQELTSKSQNLEEKLVHAMEQRAEAEKLAESALQSAEELRDQVLALRNQQSGQESEAVESFKSQITELEEQLKAYKEEADAWRMEAQTLKPEVTRLSNLETDAQRVLSNASELDSSVGKLRAEAEELRVETEELRVKALRLEDVEQLNQHLAADLAECRIAVQAAEAYGDKLKESQGEAEQLRGQVAECKNIISEINVRAQSLSAQLESESDSKVEALRHESAFQEVAEALKASTLENKLLEDQLSHVKGSMEQVNNQLKASQASCLDQQAVIATILHQLSSSEALLGAYRPGMMEIQGMLAELQMDVYAVLDTERYNVEAIDTMAYEMANLEDQNQRLMQELSLMESSVQGNSTALSLKLQSSENEIQQLCQDNETMSSLLAKTERALEEASRNIANLNKDKQELQKQLSAAEVNMIEAESGVSAADGAIRQMESRLLALQRQRDTLQQDLVLKEQELRNAALEKEEAEAEELGSKVLMAHSLAELLSNTLAEVEQRVEEGGNPHVLRQRLQEAEARNSVLNSEVMKAERDSQMLLEKLAAAEDDNFASVSSHRTLESEKRILEAEKKALVSEIGALKDEVAKLRERETQGQEPKTAGQVEQDLAEEVKAKDTRLRELEALVKHLQSSLKEAEELKVKMEEQRQRMTIKQKEQLERTQKERTKVAEEMRSAFAELTARQEKLAISKKLVFRVEQEVRILKKELQAKSVTVSPASAKQLAEISAETKMLKHQLESSASATSAPGAPRHPKPPPSEGSPPPPTVVRRQQQAGPHSPKIRAQVASARATSPTKARAPSPPRPAGSALVPPAGLLDPGAGAPTSPSGNVAALKPSLQLRAASPLRPHGPARSILSADVQDADAVAAAGAGINPKPGAKGVLKSAPSESSGVEKKRVAFVLPGGDAKGKPGVSSKGQGPVASEADYGGSQDLDADTVSL